MHSNIFLVFTLLTKINRISLLSIRGVGFNILTTTSNITAIDNKQCVIYNKKAVQPGRSEGYALLHKAVGLLNPSKFQTGGGGADAERTFLARPVDGCFCSRGDAGFDHIRVLAVRTKPERLGS